MGKAYCYRTHKWFVYCSIIPILPLLVNTFFVPISAVSILFSFIFLFLTSAILYLGLRKRKFEFNEEGFFYFNRQFELKYITDIEMGKKKVKVTFEKSYLGLKDGILAIGKPTLSFHKKYFAGKNWNEYVQDFQVLRDKMNENRI